MRICKRTHRALGLTGKIPFVEYVDGACCRQCYPRTPKVRSIPWDNITLLTPRPALPPESTKILLKHSSVDSAECDSESASSTPFDGDNEMEPRVDAYKILPQQPRHCPPEVNRNYYNDHPTPKITKPRTGSYPAEGAMPVLVPAVVESPLLAKYNLRSVLPHDSESNQPDDAFTQVNVTQRDLLPEVVLVALVDIILPALVGVCEENVASANTSKPTLRTLVSAVLGHFNELAAISKSSFLVVGDACESCQPPIKKTSDPSPLREQKLLLHPLDPGILKRSFKEAINPAKLGCHGGRDAHAGPFTAENHRQDISSSVSSSSRDIPLCLRKRASPYGEEETSEPGVTGILEPKLPDCASIAPERKIRRQFTPVINYRDRTVDFPMRNCARVRTSQNASPAKNKSLDEDGSVFIFNDSITSGQGGQIESNEIVPTRVDPIASAREGYAPSIAQTDVPVVLETSRPTFNHSLMEKDVEETSIRLAKRARVEKHLVEDALSSSTDCNGVDYLLHPTRPSMTLRGGQNVAGLPPLPGSATLDDEQVDVCPTKSPPTSNGARRHLILGKRQLKRAAEKLLTTPSNVIDDLRTLRLLPPEKRKELLNIIVLKCQKRVLIQLVASKQLMDTFAPWLLDFFQDKEWMALSRLVEFFSNLPWSGPEDIAKNKELFEFLARRVPEVQDQATNNSIRNLLRNAGLSIALRSAAERKIMETRISRISGIGIPGDPELEKRRLASAEGPKIFTSGQVDTWSAYAVQSKPIIGAGFSRRNRCHSVSFSGKLETIWEYDNDEERVTTSKRSYYLVGEAAKQDVQYEKKKMRESRVARAKLLRLKLMSMVPDDVGWKVIPVKTKDSKERIHAPDLLPDCMDLHCNRGNPYVISLRGRGRQFRVDDVEDEHHSIILSFLGIPPSSERPNSLSAHARGY